ncbi:hypothetical protein M3J09_007923 [Ascochyta lentis]
MPVISDSCPSPSSPPPTAPRRTQAAGSSSHLRHNKRLSRPSLHHKQHLSFRRNTTWMDGSLSICDKHDSLLTLADMIN